MSTELEQDATQEVINPGQEEAHDPQEIEQPVANEVPKEDLQDRNWKQARSKMDEQSHQIRMLQQELELLRNHNPQKVEPEEDEYLTDSERKLAQKIKALEAVVRKTQVQDQDAVIDRLRGKFGDFDEVMNPENIAYLKQNNPALAKALYSLREEPYEQGLAAYDALKNTEWFKQRHTMQDKERIDQNLKKPTSVQAVRKQGALSDSNRFVNGLTPELKKALQNEMAQARKGA